MTGTDRSDCSVPTARWRAVCVAGVLIAAGVALLVLVPGRRIRFTPEESELPAPVSALDVLRLRAYYDLPSEGLQGLGEADQAALDDLFISRLGEAGPGAFPAVLEAAAVRHADAEARGWPGRLDWDDVVRAAARIDEGHGSTCCADLLVRSDLSAGVRARLFEGALVRFPHGILPGLARVALDPARGEPERGRAVGTAADAIARLGADPEAADNLARHLLWTFCCAPARSAGPEPPEPEALERMLPACCPRFRSAVGTDASAETRRAAERLERFFLEGLLGLPREARDGDIFARLGLRAAELLLTEAAGEAGASTDHRAWAGERLAELRSGTGDAPEGG
jgi:hypothetical protein